MSDHAWVHENLDAYLAGGLPLEERERLEAHVAGCDACVSALAEAQRIDRVLTGLFAPARPDAALEDRVIQRLRARKPRRLLRWSMALRVVGSAAAIVVLGVLGAVVHAMASDGELPFPGMERKGRPLAMNNLFALFDDSKSLDGEDTLVLPGNFVASDYVAPLQQISKGNTAALKARLDDLHDFDLGNKLVEDLDRKPSPIDGEKLGTLKAGLDFPLGNGTNGTSLHVDRVEESKRSPQSTLNFQDTDGSITGSLGNFVGSKRAPAAGNYALGLGAPTTHNGTMGRGLYLDESRRGLAEQGTSFGRSFATEERELRREEVRLRDEAPSRAAGTKGAAGVGGANRNYYSDQLARVEDARSGGQPVDYYPPALALEFKKGPAGSSTVIGGISNRPSVGAGPPGLPLPSLAAAAKPDAAYFKPADPARSSNDQTSREKALEELRTLSSKLADLEKGPANDPIRVLALNPATANANHPPQDPSVVPPKQPEPALPAERKIIRTGELEFEIDSFDSSVAKIADIINAVKGGFIATVNSDKLPNGKVKGSVVVRMPPQFLDKFLLDLRKELGKVGELKTQRIGSQDVTKQYTDIESRLRAARTMEERFLDIIKTRKGEVKDLIAAERELGIWRTKIEEMEGEIRYFNNQVGLSTLTITLTEKEIQAAAAVVLTERVGMKVEVEDVEKAHLDALKAVAEEKGRITKSELKQHPAGQLEAILQVEVAPDKAKKLRDVFKKLGLVTFNDVQRIQQAVGGGTTGVLEAKLKQADVQIHVTLYDTANIQPRESVTMLIASDDVQASYRDLQAAVAKAKGQVRVGQLKEPDKVNINAEFNFDVPSTEKPGIDAVLAKLGVILSSTNYQAPIQETATDRKFGYRLTLRNLATVPARETSIQRIAVSDVPKVFGELQEAVVAAKGVIQVQQLNVASKVAVDAVLSFDVPKSDRQAFDKVLAKLGMVLSSTSVKAAANEITTNRKFGFKLDLVNLDSIRPKEIFTIELVTNDVRANFQELRDAVSQSKGMLYLDRLNEDMPQQAHAKLDFDIDAGKRSDIEKLLAKAGSTLKRSSNQANVNEISSDKKVGFRVVLYSIASIPPRDKASLSIKVHDVRAKATELAQQVRDNKGQATKPRITVTPQGEMSATMIFDVPIGSEERILQLCRDAGIIVDESQTTNPQVPETELATAQIAVTLTGGRPTIPTNEGFWTQMQGNLYVTFKVLSWSVMLIMLGLAVVLPWVIVIWLCVKIVRRMRAQTT